MKETAVTPRQLTADLQTRRAKGKGQTVPDITPDKLISFYTRCGRCGKELFMDDSLIVEQSTSAENFLDRCARRLFEHHCNSGTAPQV